VTYAKHDPENLQCFLYQIQYMPQHCVQHLNIKNSYYFQLSMALTLNCAAI
jgi:hypothetical protein